MRPDELEDHGDSAVAVAWMILALAMAVGVVIGLCAGLLVASL
jgi:hypothetical protein